MGASLYSVLRTMTQLDENRQYRMIAFFWEKLSLAEETYTASDRQLLALIRSLAIFLPILKDLVLKLLRII